MNIGALLCFSFWLRVLD